MMKLFAATVLSGTAQAEPIVTFQSSLDLATSSASLAIDWLYYTNDKFTEALPEEYGSRYKHLRADFRKYWQSYANPVVSTVQEKYATHSGQFIKTLGLIYSHLESMANVVIDPVVQEFELRHPSQAGVIGKSLADRITLLVWIYVLAKAAFKMILPSKKRSQF